jgi:glycosyltransferase involved in cell wall biosynthesis
MKLLWLCNYSLYYLKSQIGMPVDHRKFHPTTWIHYLVEEMKKRDVELILITASPYVKKTTILTENNVTYHIIPRDLSFIGKGYPSWFRLDTMTHYFVLKNAILKTIKAYKPDFITAHGTEDVYSLPLLETAIPSAVWIQGFMTDIIKTNPDDKFLKKQFVLEQKVLKQQKAFISNCSDFDDYFYSQNKQTRIFYLSYPISNETFSIPDPEKDADICFTGSFLKRKGIEDFIEMIHLLKQKHPNIRAKIIGGHLTSEYGAHLKEKITRYRLNGNLVIKGYLPEHSDVLMEMKKSRVFVLPSYFDTGPRCIAESMALKVPVAAYKIKGVSWMLGENNERGITVPIGNIEQLAEAVERLLENRDQTSAMTENAYAFAVSHFMAFAVVDGLFNIYQQILTNK